MNDDLTRPLAVQKAGQGRMWPVYLLLLAIVIVAMAGFVLRQMQMEQTPIQEASLREAPVAQADNGTDESEPARTEAPDKSSNTDEANRKLEPLTPAGDYDLASESGELVELDAVPAHLPNPEFSERISSGILPKRAPDNRRPMDIYARKPETEGNFGVARVVLIVGGLGLSQTGTLRAIRDLPPGVTLAFAPYGNSLTRWMQEARKAGHELLLQIPMEPIDYPQNNPGQHTLLADAGSVENIANLHWFMSRVTNYVGVMNYLGGKFLSDDRALKPVFDELASRGLLYVDDGSMRNSTSGDVAASALLPFAQADLRLDIIRDRSKIKERLDRLAERARRTGMAIGYANAFPESISVIAEFAANAGQREIEITPVSAAVRDPARE